ncbi:MAG: DNA polymerase [Bilifractor sp.]
MHTLSIDLETYSDQEINEVGVQRYVDSDAFEILLIGFSLDGWPVRCIDVAAKESVPQWFVDALHSPDYIKHAFNATFEFTCLSKVYGEMNPVQWRDTMLDGLYNGFPTSLEATGAALGLAEDKQKDKSGKELIRYFCKPCKPTKKNGGRTRNYWYHDTDKWGLFKSYNKQDVVTEMAIASQLANSPVPDFVQKQWQTDLSINRHGVGVDMDLVNGALRIGATVADQLRQEAKDLTGLSNPNSIPQLKGWLERELNLEEPIKSLSKDVVEELLKSNQLSENARRVLEIRQELGKTSTKKYDAIKACECPSDGRVHGLLQFYGANRTGRWAGRLVQVQNLPRTYTKAIEVARHLVKSGNAAQVRLIYGNVNDTLSQLIRTAFVPTPGNVFIDADFSAIEARVISWLAGETWRLNVFKTHGKIYEASASQMFNVPIEKIKKGNPEYALRAKGKVAELALGYNGGTGALIRMGALDMGLSEDELPDIVEKWRTANPHIKRLWYEMEEAAVNAISGYGTQWCHGLKFAREYDQRNQHTYMTILLPSQRKLYYVDPGLTKNNWGGDSISYKGIDQATKQWKTLETYGGKLVENCVQAIARDCLAEAIERLTAQGYPIVFHIHDEVVIDIKPYAEADKMLQDVVNIMKQPPRWAPDLPLNADGWVGDFFTKD